MFSLNAAGVGDLDSSAILAPRMPHGDGRNQGESTHELKKRLMTRKRSAGFRGWESTRALLPAGAILMLVAGCSLLPGGAGEGGGTHSSGSSHSGQTNEDEANMPVIDAVKSSSNDISLVEVGLESKYGTAP